MFKSIAKLFSGPNRSPRRPTPTARLAVESLEARRVMTVGTISMAYGMIEIQGTNVADRAEVRIDAGNPWNLTDDQVVVTLYGSGFSVTQASYQLRRMEYVNGHYEFRQNVSGVRFFGGDGNDTFTNDTGLLSLAWGGAGVDHLVGGSGVDRFHGDGGNDILEGNGGNDYLAGDGGRDTIYGGIGDDYLDGGYDAPYTGYSLGDADELWGGAGADRFANYGQYGRLDFFKDFNKDEGDTYDYPQVW